MFTEHPNARPQNHNAVMKLQQRFGEFQNFISHDLSVSDLAKNEVLCVITVYGSISVEASYAGIPVIAAGYSLYSPANLVNLATDKEQYFELLEKCLSNQLYTPNIEDVIAVEALVIPPKNNRVFK